MKHNMAVIKKRVRAMADAADGPIEPGSPEYRDIMQNIENDVQLVLEEEGYLEY